MNTNENFEPLKVSLNLDLQKPKGVDITKAELDVVLQGAINFIQFHLNMIIAQKTKNPNPNLN